MSTEPRASGAAIVRALERLGFSRVRQRGSHLVLERIDLDGRRRICVVPLHDEVAVGTLRSLLRQAGLTLEELRDQL